MVFVILHSLIVICQPAYPVADGPVHAIKSGKYHGLDGFLGLIRQLESPG